MTPAHSALPGHGRLVGKLLLLVAAAFAFGFALVPLYSVLCAATGFNGKTAERKVIRDGIAVGGLVAASPAPSRIDAAGYSPWWGGHQLLAATPLADRRSDGRRAARCGLVASCGQTDAPRRLGVEKTWHLRSSKLNQAYWSLLGTCLAEYIQRPSRIFLEILVLRSRQFLSCPKVCRTS